MNKKETRIELCRNSFKHFFFWYFSKYMHHASPLFHYQMFQDCNFKGFQFLVWIMFRDSAKTAIARALVVWWIVYEKKHNIGWVGEVLKKAAKNARAIANELQANKKIISDFGQLYYEDTTAVTTKQSRPKVITDFKCENGVFFRALSTQVSTRGELESEWRPDAYILDDFENDKTKGSFLKTRSVINFMEETIAGASADCCFLFLCNFITKYGSVAYLKKKAHKNANWLVRIVRLIENGKITWPSKYVKTKAEAAVINEDCPNKKMVKSIEQMIEDMGSARFDQENQHIPDSEGGGMIREEWLTNGRASYSKDTLLMDDKEENFFWETDDGTVKGTVFTAVDPAISKKESSDDRSIVTIARFIVPGTTPKKKFYLVFESKAGKWGTDDFARKLKDTQDKFNPRKTAVENVGVQEAFRDLFAMYGISTQAINPDGDKVRRMSRNVADLEFGRVLFPDDGSCDDLKHELIDFTGEDGKPDNRVDAFNYAMQLAKAGRDTGYKNTEDGGTETGGVMGENF